jgi:hypothetical protein
VPLFGLDHREDAALETALNGQLDRVLGDLPFLSARQRRREAQEKEEQEGTCVWRRQLLTRKHREPRS